MQQRLDDLDLISSGSNPLVKLTRQLAERRRARYREGLLLIEGERVLETALQHNADIQTVMVDADRRGEISPAVFAAVSRTAARIVAVESALFKTLADTEHPQAMLAIARLPEHDFPEQATMVVALDAVRDPGNLGTIIRTAAAAGCDAVALLPGCVDPFHPAVVRASAGTVFSLPIVHFASLDALVHDYFAHFAAANVVAADSEGPVDYRDLDWALPTILVAGNEAHGLSEQVLAATTSLVRIPMAEGIESLNVSVATGILLFHVKGVRDGR